MRHRLFRMPTCRRSVTYAAVPRSVPPASGVDLNIALTIGGPTWQTTSARDDGDTRGALLLLPIVVAVIGVAAPVRADGDGDNATFLATPT